MESNYIFESYHQLYGVIKDQPEFLNKYTELKKFKDYLYLSKHGCRSCAVKNEYEGLEIYKKLSTIDKSAFDDIKLLVESNHLIFKLKDQIIFEI